LGKELTDYITPILSRAKLRSEETKTLPMRFTVLILLLCLFSSILLGQAEGEKQKLISLYSNFQFEDYTYEIDNSNGNTVEFERPLQLGIPSFGIRSKRENGWSREFEINSINLFKVEDRTSIISLDSLNTDQVVAGFRTSTSSLGLRYEWMKNYFTSKSEKINLYIGVGLGAGAFYLLTEPKVSTSFRTRLLDLGLSSQIVPRLTYKLSNRTQLDFNLVGEWLATRIVTETTENPRIPVRQQRTSDLDLSFFSPKAQLRVGVVIDISDSSEN